MIIQNRKIIRDTAGIPVGEVWGSLEKFKARIDSFFAEGYTEINFVGSNKFGIEGIVTCHVGKLRVESDEEFKKRIEKERILKEINETEERLRFLKGKNLLNYKLTTT